VRRRTAVAATGAALGTIALLRARRVRPVTLVLGRAALLPAERRARVQKRVIQTLYDTMTLLMRRSDVGLLNYGYASLDETEVRLESAADASDRYTIQLYERVAGALPLRGLDVLEVGCGRGGGTAHLFERYEPRSMTGLDLSLRSFAHCRRRYGRPGLEFVAGDAENLPFPDASFDAVVNVESSHCYPDAARFFSEVARDLRPGGVLLFADVRHTSPAPASTSSVGDVGRLREQMAAAGMVVAEEEDISANVRRALELDSPRRRAAVEANTPRLMRAQMLDFAGIEGSGVHRGLSEGTVTYLRMVLRPARDAASVET
jgi:SAM-dependent methyltransferase